MSYRSVVPFLPGLRELYVNHGTGDDTAAGTAGAPLATIQEAVNRFKPMDRGTQLWDLNDDRTIHVQDPGGGSDFGESIVIQSHSGEGALHIKAVVTTLHTGLVESGTPFSAIAGFEVRQQLSFTTSPMTPSALADAAFVVPQTNLLGNPFEYGWDYLPIVDNAAGTCDVVALDPGVLTSFSHGAAVVVDIIQPDIIWKNGTTDAFGYYHTSCIMNHGGPLIVEGFRFQNSRTGYYGNVLVVNHGESDDAWGTKTCFRACIVENNTGNYGFISLAHGTGVQFAGVIYKANNLRLFQGVPGSSIINTRAIGLATSGSGAIGFENTSSLTIYGLDADNSASPIKSVGFYGATVVAAFIDVRGGYFYMRGCPYTSIQALSVEGAGAAPAISVGPGTSLGIGSATSNGRLSGTTGNNQYGLHVHGPNSATEIVTVTGFSLSGALGDVKVGDNPVKAWDSGPETDMTKMARITG